MPLQHPLPDPGARRHAAAPTVCACAARQALAHLSIRTSTATGAACC